MKLAWLLFAESPAAARACARPLLTETGPKLLARGARAVTVNVADVEADLGASMPLLREHESLAALLTLRLPGGVERSRLEAELARVPGRWAGYRVRESVPLAYADRDWPDGAPSPGVKLVTCFNEKPGLSDEHFFHEWHEVHTPLSLEVHPLWCYVRNVVEAPLSGDAPRFRGIVEEQFRTLDAVTDQEHFYGASGDWRRGFERVSRHVPGFLDLATMRNALMTEHILESP